MTTAFSQPLQGRTLSVRSAVRSTQPRVTDVRPEAEVPMLAIAAEAYFLPGVFVAAISPIVGQAGSALRDEERTITHWLAIQL